MNQLVKDWIAALRSGNYKQGSGVLYNPTDNSYCCLGVACEIAGYHRPSGETLQDFPKVRTLLGLWSDNGSYGGEDAFHALTADNDGVINYSDADGREYYETPPKTFDQIADIIESRPEGLFRDD